MSLKMRTKTRETPPSTGDQEGSQAQASETFYGWKRLFSIEGENPEVSVARSVNTHDGAIVRHAGERVQSYDLEIPTPNSPYLRGRGLTPGRYEVKSLWRRSETHAFDRRFKVGKRGERIYGRRDAQIKSFALGLEEQIDSIVEFSVTGHPRAEAGSVLSFVDETHDFVDRALARRHSHSFHERLLRLARASLRIPVLADRAYAVVSGGVQANDIVDGFSDIEGIFVVAGPMYTLVTKDEMPQFLAFDSANAEGPKLRWSGGIPSEATTKRTVLPSKQDSVRKEKKEAKK